MDSSASISCSAKTPPSSLWQTVGNFAPRFEGDNFRDHTSMRAVNPLLTVALSSLCDHTMLTPSKFSLFTTAITDVIKVALFEGVNLVDEEKQKKNTYVLPIGNSKCCAALRYESAPPPPPPPKKNKINAVKRTCFYILLNPNLKLLFFFCLFFFPPTSPNSGLFVIS